MGLGWLANSKYPRAPYDERRGRQVLRFYEGVAITERG